jgi:hypothetical protein
VALDGTFTRPVFFDGQLLTSDDLQALVAYTRGKDRLHNRYLVGSGVVCGLQVVCSRAAQGSVVVRSGYALDCCGNDIVVPCDQQVDLMSLVAGLSGDGCPDPCPPPAADAGKQARPRPRRYELVVEYTETPGDLVAPYASGNESSRACEATRCNEGYRFALRCPGERCGKPSGLIGALACCADAERRLEGVERAAQVARRLAGEPEPDVKAPNDSEVEVAIKNLRAAPHVSHAVTLASMGARLAAAGDAAEAGRALGEVRENLGRVRVAAEGDPLSSAQVNALDQETESLATRLAEPARTRADRLLAAGVAYSAQVSDTVRSLVTEARDWALCWLEQHPATHCQTAECLVSMPADGNDRQLYQAAQTVIGAIRQILLDCVCAAINPPCTPCEDTAVVLADVTIDGCEVTDICNLARRYPLTGTALGYWLPVDWLLCEAEQICCGQAAESKMLSHVRGVLHALGENDKRSLPGIVTAAASVAQVRAAADVSREPAEPSPEPAVQEKEPLDPGEHRLLTMLNSQVQSLQAKVRKLEKAEQARAGQQAPAAEEQAPAAGEQQHG